jgi:signal transduction histidine kinase
VTLRIAEHLPTLHADPARIELVLLNLVSNAIKYSDPEKADSFVEIVVAPAEPGAEDSCTICIRDNGLGINDANQTAIFDRFFRAHAHLDGELGISGTGLGLAIVADCVEALGGTIRCESREGEGTAFFTTLPLTTPAASR